MKKYWPLYNYLLGLNKDEVNLSYEEIIDIIGVELPASAYKHRPWWVNDPNHSQAQAWLKAGWKVDAINIGVSVNLKRS